MMGAKSGQIAIVLILGSALLIYGGATGRLADAWKGLTGGSSTPPAPPADSEKLEDSATADTTGQDRPAPQVADLMAQHNGGGLTVRGGGVI